MSEVDTSTAAYEALLASLPLPEALPRGGDTYEPKKIEEAFDAFRRHIAALQSEVYELKMQAAQRPEPVAGDAARAETVRLVQAGAELARAIEQEARDAAAMQIAQLAEELAPRRRELRERELAIERERVEILEVAQTEVQAQLEGAERRAAEELAQAKSQAEKILQQARREASELSASAQSEVEQMLERARAESRGRARRGEKAAPPPQERADVEPAPTEPAPEAAPPSEAAPPFTTPPLSLEDLAARGVSRLRSESTEQP
jgi:hypothetical protein